MNQYLMQSLLQLTQLELVLVFVWLFWRKFRASHTLGVVVQSKRGRLDAYAGLLLASWTLTLLAQIPLISTQSHVYPYFLVAGPLLVIGMTAILFVYFRAAMACALGRDGVQSGWTVARFDEFAEWRLTGAHLRFRLEGKLWEAIEVGADHQAALRTRLEQAAPDRESRYTE